MLSLLLVLVPFQTDPRDEYTRRAKELRDSDAEGHYRLGLWCEQKKLADSARTEFEKTIAAQPGHEAARAKLGHRKIDGIWVSRRVLDAVSKGLRFPPDDEARAFRSRGPFFARVIDIFWELDLWAAALARIDDRAGVFDGALDVTVKFADLKTVPAMGDGSAGRGTISLDIAVLADYEKKADEFARKAAGGGTVVVPPAKTSAIITHELAHCFQGTSQPAWFLEGMATWCAGDGHFVYYFRHERQRILDLDSAIDHKYVYARGWSFFEYVDAKYGRAKAKEFVKLCVGSGLEAKSAAARVSGKEWGALKIEEREWSARWIQNYRSK